MGAPFPSRHGRREEDRGRGEGEGRDAGAPDPARIPRHRDPHRGRRPDHDRCRRRPHRGHAKDRRRRGADLRREAPPAALIMQTMKRLAITLLIVIAFSGHAVAQSSASKPEGQMRWALYVTLATSWFDPGEITGGFLTPFWILYAMHDALVKPMPGNLMTPSLAESWTVSADQRVYDFKLREGLKFHNGDPFTADDVKFSFQRSKAGKALKDRVREVEVMGPARVRFH